MKPSRSMRLPFEPAEHCYEEWYMAPDYAGDLYRKLEVSPAPYKYNVGEVFTPYDNSYCIDLETGKHSYITPAYCIDEEEGTVFTIVEEPYYDLILSIAFGQYVSRRFVTVMSKNTGKLYRVLCREVDYMDYEENLDVNNIKILENKSRSEEIKQAAQAYYPAGTLHEEKAVSAFIRGAKWADNSRPQSYSKQELRDMRLWIARDKDNTLCVYNNKPTLSKEVDGLWVCDKFTTVNTLSEDYFPEITFENSPMEIELKFVEK